MKITLLVIGKTDAEYLREGIAVYMKRLKHYVNFVLVEIPDIKNVTSMSPLERTERECALLLEKHIHKTAHVILLDEHGRARSSKEFATHLEKKIVGGIDDIIFVVGGPYGFTEELKKRANETLALSLMTFSHQMVRLIFVEQLYRAFTIMKGEPYHHE